MDKVYARKIIEFDNTQKSHYLTSEITLRKQSGNHFAVGEKWISPAKTWKNTNKQNNTL